MLTTQNANTSIGEQEKLPPLNINFCKLENLVSCLVASHRIFSCIFMDLPMKKFKCTHCNSSTCTTTIPQDVIDDEISLNDEFSEPYLCVATGEDDCEWVEVSTALASAWIFVFSFVESLLRLLGAMLVVTMIVQALGGCSRHTEVIILKAPDSVEYAEAMVIHDDK